MKKRKNSSYRWGATVCMLSAMLVGCISAPPNSAKSAAVSAPPSVAPSSTETKPFQKAAFSGVPETFAEFSQVNPDCTSAGRPTVIVTHAASHGSVEIKNDTESYANFPSNNQRYECNKKKFPSVSVVYTAEKSFVGPDKLSIKRVSRFGEVLTQDYVITVEQLPDTQVSVRP